MIKLSQALLGCGISLKDYVSSEDRLTLVLGTLISRDDSLLASNVVKSTFAYFSCMEDPVLHVKTKLFSKYEVGTEEGVLGVILAQFTNNLDETIQKYVDELDEGYLSAECNVGEEEAEEFIELLSDKKLTLVLGADLEFHPKAQNLASLIALLSKIIDVDVTLVGQKSQESKAKLEAQPEVIEELATFDGTVVYCCPATVEDEKKMLFGSAQFGVAAKAQNGQKVIVQTKTDKYERIFKVDDSLKGTIALLPQDSEILSYRYGQSKITQVG